jgi:hypothetical protein
MSEIYRQNPAISQSDLKLILKSPLHYIHRDKLHGEETAAMKLGSAFHAAVLEPQKFKEDYLQLPSTMPNGEPINRRRKADKEYLAQIALENPSKIALTEDEMDALTGMLNAIVEHPVANSLFQGGVAEQVKFWTDEDYSCKGKCDYFHPKHPMFGKAVLVELKTALDASPEGFSREVLKRGYDFQAAWYKRGFGADRFISVVVEKAFPYAIGVYDMEEYIPHGERKIALAFDKLRELDNNDGVSHGYTHTIETLQVPSWVAAQGE